MTAPGYVVETTADGPPILGRAGLVPRLMMAIFVAGIFTIVMAVAVWPGEMKLVAPLFCDDAQPDAIVVADSYSPTPGETVYNFSMYCVGERGDATELGLAKPMAVLFGIHLAIAIVFVLWTSRPSATRAPRTKPRRRSKPAPGSTAGPFVS